MRFNETVCNSMPPMHFTLHNNNQLQRSSSELIINEKVDYLTGNQDSQEFHIGQDTSTYSSLALTRNNNKIIEHNINNNLDNTYQSSSIESLADFAGYYEEEDDEPDDITEGSDWSEYSEDGNLPAGCRGIVNPNYPGFQHLGPSLLSDTDDTDDERGIEDEIVVHEDVFNNNNNNNNSIVIVDETVNKFDAQRDEQKQLFYEKPKFNLQIGHRYFQSVSELIECMNLVKGIHNSPTHLPTNNHGTSVYDDDVEIVQLATSVKETLQFPEIEQIPDSAKNSEAEEVEDTVLEEPIDLIREANALQTVVPFNNNDDLTYFYLDNNNQKLQDDYQPISTNPFRNNPFLNPPTPIHEVKKLEEIDLLAGCREHRIKNQPQQSVPDVVAMELDVLQEPQQQEQQLIEDSNKLINLDIPETITPVANANVNINVNLKPEKVTNVCVASKKHQKTLRNQAGRWQQQSNNPIQRNRQESKRRNDVESGSFDVYNIETAMPKIDLDAIESHLKAAREEERRRRNDREEIRRRLAMGPDAEDVRNERGRKPSLQSRLQSGMNLQICFMNDTSSDTESLQEHDAITPSYSGTSSESSSSSSSIATSPLKQPPVYHKSEIEVATAAVAAVAAASSAGGTTRPQVLSLPELRLEPVFNEAPIDEADFFARQARLQTEARLALAQAKEMAHMQMEIERQKMKQNPITEMVRASLQKIGVTLGEDRRRLTRALLTELNIAQLQVLANDLHARIAQLNDALVDGLLRRDDLHMEQDSMLVDVEDLTRYLGAKQESFKKRQHQQQQPQQQPRNISSNRKKPQQRQTTSRTIALLNASTKFAAGRQLVANLVRK